MNKSELECSFCNANGSQVDILVSGNNEDIWICASCVETCNNIVKQQKDTLEEKEEEEKPPEATYSPKKIREFLDQYVIGQDNAKKIISVSAYNHYKRLVNPDDSVDIDKSNILLIGPTGSGKTLLAHSLAKCLDVPCVIYDSTKLTESGYVGDDTDAIITQLMAAAGGDIDKAERGIIFIDEIDKKRGQASNGRDVNGEGAQQSLLRLIEGTEMAVKGSTRRINTKNILFILSGAFVGLSEQISGKKSIGFGSEKALVNNNTIPTTEQLIKYGMIPELIGRLPVVAKLESLDRDQLVTILTTPKNAIIKQYQALFKMDNADLEITKKALNHIANIAIDNDTGARGLRNTLETHLVEVQYTLPEMVEHGVCKFIIDEEDSIINIKMFDNQNKNIAPIL
jgi:ATP-dependent Clp protease ATP-binding subunit ClpX